MKSVIRRDVLFGAQRLSNYLFGTLLLLGGLAFFCVGVLSRLEKNHIDAREIKFLPQGLVICFYGSIAIGLGLYLFLRRFLSVGSGFNEYNKETKQIHIFRQGFPGKNRRVEFFFTFSELESLRLEVQSRWRQSNAFELYLLLKDKRKFLLTQVGTNEVQSLQEIEYFAADLARFLQIPLEGNLY
jgi:hypothetical protein